MTGTYQSKHGPVEGCPVSETPLRERAWADGQRPEAKYSDAEVDRVAKLIADKCGNGMREKYEDVARTIVESLLASRPSKPDKAGVSDADALAHFTEYFVRNYPGPDTIISNPKWHAPKIFRAAQYAITHYASQSAEAVRDGDGQTLPPGWRIEVRENAGALGLCVFGPVGSFAVDGETSHKSDIRADVIRELRAAMQEQSRD